MRWPLLFLIGLVACQVGLPDEQQRATPTSATATSTLSIGINLVTRVRPTAVFLQPPTATPLPPPTTTPSPTPIIYQIQAGDTLLDLAIQQGVEVADIEALNPGLRPELLQIGQEVVLPPLQTAVFLTNQVTPIPLQLTIVQLQLYQMPTGAAWIVGEVLNEGSQAVEAVEIGVSLLSATGEVVETASAWTATTIIPAQTKASFGLLLPSLPEGVQPAAAVVGGQTMVDLGSRYLDFAVEEAELAEGLMGILHNSGMANARQIRLVASLYDQNETIVGFVRRDFVQLAAGERVPFFLELGGLGETAVSYTFLTESLQQP